MIHRNNFQFALHVLVLAIVSLSTSLERVAEAFVLSVPLSSSSNNNNLPATTTTRKTTFLQEEAGDNDNTSDHNGLSPPEQTVYDILQQMHESKFPFRLVVIGNGAILETTSPLGPKFKLGQSPRTGEHLVTFASDDASFEFHLMFAQISKIVMTQKEGPVKDGNANMLDIFRFLTDEGKPMCSLILADKSDAGKKWFQDMMEKYNNGDVQL